MGGARGGVLQIFIENVLLVAPKVAYPSLPDFIEQNGFSAVPHVEVWTGAISTKQGNESEMGRRVEEGQ